jgi:hypothetical protein
VINYRKEIGGDVPGGDAGAETLTSLKSATMWRGATHLP